MTRKRWSRSAVVAVTATGVVAAGGVAAVALHRWAKASTPPVMPLFCPAAATVDHEFHDALVAILNDPRERLRVRLRAGAAALMFRTYWLDAGKAGWAISPDFRRPLYGNYCGPGYANGGACVDAIDCVCQIHDERRTAAFADMVASQGSVHV
jgi:hypothetical protein